MELNGTHQLVTDVDVHLVRKNINTIKKNTETALDGSKETGVEINTEKTRYMLCLITKSRTKLHYSDR
jgi:hypothetical protein